MPVPRRWVGTRCGFSEREVFLPLPGMELDFGGVVKEYAADAAAMVAGKGRHPPRAGQSRRRHPHRGAAGGRSAVADWNRPSTAPGCGHRHAAARGRRGDDIGRIRAVRRDRGAAIRPPDRSPERVARGWSVERQRGREPGDRRGVDCHGRVAAAAGRGSGLARAVRSAVSGRRRAAPLSRALRCGAGRERDKPGAVSPPAIAGFASKAGFEVSPSDDKLPRPPGVRTRQAPHQPKSAKTARAIDSPDNPIWFTSDPTAASGGACGESSTQDGVDAGKQQFNLGPRDPTHTLFEQRLIEGDDLRHVRRAPLRRLHSGIGACAGPIAPRVRRCCRELILQNRRPGRAN